MSKQGRSIYSLKHLTLLYSENIQKKSVFWFLTEICKKLTSSIFTVLCSETPEFLTPVQL